MRRYGRRTATALTAIALSVVLAACGSSTSDSGSNGGNNDGNNGGSGSSSSPGVTDTTIDYGLIYDQTGTQNTAQGPWANGVITQLRKANDAGGINGRTINIIQIDDKSDVTQGTIGYKRLVDQTPVLAISGINASSFQEAILPQIRENGMVLVGPQSTTKAGLVPFNKTAFYIIPNYADQVDVILGYMKDKLSKPQPKVAVFRLTASSGIEVDELVKAGVTAAGGEVVASEEINPAATNADAQIQNIVNAQPDFIVFHTSPTLSLLGLRSLEKLGAKIPVISTFAGGGPVGYDGVGRETGELFEYTAGVVPSDVEVAGTETLKADAEKYGYGEQTGDTAYVFGYITGGVIVEGLKRAGKELTRESFVEALESIENFDTGGISGPVTYGTDNRAGLKSTVVVNYDYDAEKFVTVGNFSDYDKYITNQYSN